ncbi:MAG TPA: zinc ribbon domain-containing protein [Steroidobacteraceae bacterium]|nr:zinc ribbon domain-containing protein [Steroidobacteraceae bacterium]
MPFYEYECSNCKFYVEIMQKIADAPIRKCPSCGRNTLKKLVSAPNFRLKGGGWYETDFKSEKESKRNLAEAEKGEAKEPKAAETPTGGATDAKPAEPKSGAAKPAASGSAAVSASAGSSRKPAARRPTARGKRKANARPARKARR